MSWGVGAIGKAPAVRAEIQRQSKNVKCSEPEETVRLAALDVIDAALAAQGHSVVVKVGASGSQSSYRADDGSEMLRNQLAITIEAMHGFIE